MANSYRLDDGDIPGREGGAALHLCRLDGEESDGEDERVQPHVHPCQQPVLYFYIRPPCTEYYSGAAEQK